MNLGRVVTTGRRDGLAVVAEDRVADPTPLAGAEVAARFLHDSAACQVSYLTIEPGANHAYHRFIVSALGDLADATDPGFHTTPTLDIVFVISGQVRLELDSESTDLGAGDVVVQDATRHRWTNIGAGPVVLASVVLPNPDV